MDDNGINKPIILSGYSSQRNAAAIARHMNAEYVPVRYDIHNNGEIKPVLAEKTNLRAAPVVVIASAAGAPNSIIFETQELQLIARTGWGGWLNGKIITYTPHLIYGRQDSTFGQQAPIGLNIALRNLFGRSDAAVICDPHNANVTMNTLTTMEKYYQPIHFAVPFALQIRHVMKQADIDPKNAVLMGLDKGGVDRLGEDFMLAMSRITGMDLPTEGKHLPYLDKRRDKNNRNKPSFHGVVNGTPASIRGKHVFGIEDLVDTGGSVIDGADYTKTRLHAASFNLLSTNALLSAPRIEETLNVVGFDGKSIKRWVENPDPLVSVRKINEAGEKGIIDSLFFSKNMDHALTDPAVAAAIADSKLMHEFDDAPFTARILSAICDPHRNGNTVSNRLSGDPKYIDEIPFEPTPLKPGNALLLKASR